MDRDTIKNKYDSIIENINSLKDKYNINYNIDVVAVSKYSSIETIKEFLSLNINLPLGESKAQSLRDRAEELNKNYDNIIWHFIGRIQSNKVKYIVKYADLIQSVDSIEIAEYINKEAIKNNKVQDILLQFNISNEEQKGGFNLSDYNMVYDKIKNLPNVNIKGLMGISLKVDNDFEIEKEFESLNEVFIKLKDENTSILSMGMTNDYHLAIKHGANMIRIGSGFLGYS
ncbi:YggS family pyridoxal phosphate-dependent enzyme [Brachyspira pilosicoli]|uniref:Pyridoxal phosphate homeostasis protein n=2 Tax=Brachyspira pilosicoli TaxID=52584 RepID=D8IG86_BRAP9|nr:YggS family pyridoxal phosphate-dependent enzyme [Brachyspira pilosicoli]ADK32150.1 proline synthetase associated protein [Brachyspira pilosicoli 95/1000]WIH91081.1 YggS family pyridoxal phosphate-dependent enzyme [Brachyspira pilosicoli]WIH93372.1 YggS family pyridoxal phosphate-dependent enzyme [Brachyspira pilosicoli]WIH95662.1 YggS family pyridoxal phosphate-dependent enzyme [Brachyspira pilosicoli]